MQQQPWWMASLAALSEAQPVEVQEAVSPDEPEQTPEVSGLAADVAAGTAAGLTAGEGELLEPSSDGSC